MRRGRILLCVLGVWLTCACAVGGQGGTPEPTSASPAPEAVPATSATEEQAPSQVGVDSVPDVTGGPLVELSDFEYLGAFRLPGGEDRPLTFAYGGSAMTYRPDGDPSGADDGFPGSLFIVGHDRLPYGELPDGSQIAEVSIPAPVKADAPEGLGQAQFLQGFANVAEGAFAGLDELPRVGLAYLDVPATGPAIHVAWGAHFQPDPPVPSHGWFTLDLAGARMQGSWFIAGLSPYSVNGYMLEIPADWAAAYAKSRMVGTGRFRDGGWSGMGPALVAYRPWDDDGMLAKVGAELEATVLLRYASSEETETIEDCLSGYQHSDEWEGAAWLSIASGESAVLFAGTKAVGDRYWYGYLDPAAPEEPCVDTEFLGQFPLCRLADGSPCPESDLQGCGSHNDYRGWWSSAFTARFLLYDPADLARVAVGEMESWEPQPYATLDIDEHLLHNPAGVDTGMLGSGAQRRYRIGEVAYDRGNSLLYVLELFADGAKPVVHVWRVG